MFAEIIKNMYGISLQEFAIMIIDSIAYFISLLIVVFSFFKITKATQSKNANGALLSILATVASSFAGVRIVESSETIGFIEVTALLIPSIFTLLSAVCFYRLSNELIQRYS